MSNRRKGTSTLIKEMAGLNDVWILVATTEQKRDFGENAISLTELENFKGKESKPILVDNYAMLRLSEEAFQEINRLKDKIKVRDELITDVKRLMDRFEAQYGKFK